MSTRKIYFAGGCFWGVEHFFKGVDGVLSTMPGYAGGAVDQPSYEQVYTDTTGHAETVEVIYDPSRVSLLKLTRLFFASIDPLALNRQGHDVGTRYRTGVFYDNPDDLLTLQEAFSQAERRLGVPPVTELLPLQRFWPAEERHRDYLGKNSSGYCHLPLKAFKYLRLYQDLELLLGDEPDPIARQSQTAALLQERMHFFWTGFYKVEEDELVLGPFQGPPACFRIARGRGVCGSAWERGRTLVVPDVEEFPGHIACSSESRSEIVVPVLRDGSVTAVLDIDSTSVATFDDTDATWLELITELL